MSIQSVNSPNVRPPLAMMPHSSPTRAGSANGEATAANQSDQPRGVELLRRELESRSIAMKDSQQPPGKLLARLAATIEPANTLSDLQAKPRQADAGKLAPADISSSAPATIQKSAATPSKVSLSDVNAALASINVSTLTADGEPMTQEWIDKQITALNEKGIQSRHQSSGSQMYEITIDGLLANWGKSDSIYDLTGNGTVDGEDLLVLLSNGGKMMVEASAGTEPELTLEGLLAAWGQSDSPYDFTGNGTVDGSDLLYFLQWMKG